MSAVADNGPARALSPLGETAQRTNQDRYSQKCHLDQVDAPEQQQQQSPLGSYSSYLPSEVGALHRVTSMLKEKKLRPMTRDSRESSPVNSDSENNYSHSNGHDTPPKMRYSVTDGSISPRYGVNHPNNNNNNNNSLSESNMQDLSSPLPRHPISLSRKDMMMTTENSKVLRGILQGKDFQERHQIAENGAESIGEDSREEDTQSNTLEGSMAGDFDMDRDSMRSGSGSPGNLSSDGSDQENNMNNLNGMHSMDEDMRMDGRMDFSPENYCPSSEGLEAKRARVENIISSMRVSPLKALNDTASGMGDIRRPKRKQYIPQQHDIYHESSPKIRRQEKDVLQRQLKQIQEQLTAMQNRHPELFDGECQEPPELCTESAELSQARKEMANMRNILKERSFDNFSGRVESRIKSDENSNTETVQLVKEACKFMKEHESDIMKNSLALSAAVPDLNNLAKVLKAELASSVEHLVDNVVARFAAKQAKKDSLKELEKVCTPVVKELRPPPVRDTIISTPANTNNNSHSHVSIHNSSIFTTPISTNATNTISPCPKPPTLITASDDMDRSDRVTPKPTRTKVTDKITHPFFDMHPKPFFDLARAHPPLFAPPPYYPHVLPHLQPLFPKEPEQTEALPLVVNTPKKKRTKVTDTRLSPRAARALLQDGLHPGAVHPELEKVRALTAHGEYPHHPLVPVSLPTSVAIPNPSLQHPDIMALYNHPDRHNHFGEFKSSMIQSPNMSIGDHSSPTTPHTQSEGMPLFKNELENMYSDHHHHHHHHMGEGTTFDGHPITSTLTPMHLRKAKLMFFYVRYPSSSILKIYFPDVKFNKNNTAQLVKWFSNFREFFYIQMEKYARQFLAEGAKNPEEVVVGHDSELYRVINLHYNRNNQIEVPETFLNTVQCTLREFFCAIQGAKDTEQSWKKSIYKVIARLDETIPEYFKSPNWMEMLNEAC